MFITQVPSVSDVAKIDLLGGGVDREHGSATRPLVRPRFLLFARGRAVSSYLRAFLLPSVAPNYSATLASATCIVGHDVGPSNGCSGSRSTQSNMTYRLREDQLTKHVVAVACAALARVAKGLPVPAADSSSPFGETPTKYLFTASQLGGFNKLRLLSKLRLLPFPKELLESFGKAYGFRPNFLKKSTNRISHCLGSRMYIPE